MANRRKIRVAFAEAGSGRGGSAYSLLRIGRILARDFGDIIEPLYLAFGDDGCALFKNAGFQTCAFSSNNFVGRFLETRSLLKRKEINILHCNNDPYGHFAHILAAKTCGVPMTVHFRASREMTWLEKISLGWMRHAFSVSQKGSDHIVSSGKIRKEDATMLGDGVIPEDYCGKDKEGISVRGQLSIGVDEFVVMLPATLQPGKGQNLTVQAARLLANKGLKIKWLLAGSEHYQFPGFKGKLRQAVAESGCETSVLLLGHRDDIPELLAASDIMLLPSVLTEGKPCTIMEAMAAGKPVVASRVGGIPEMVDDEVGMLIDPGDPSAIAGAVEKFFGDRELLKRCGDAARTRAGQRYNAGAITQKMVEVFSSIIKDGIA